MTHSKKHISVLLLALACGLAGGCASVKYDKTGTDGTHVSGSMRSVFSTSAIKGFQIEHTTKTTGTGLAIKEGNTDPNSEAIKALGDVIGNLAESVAKGAAKGVVPIP